MNWNSREDRGKFYRSTPWRKLRSLKLDQNPLCERCALSGKLTPATDVHHKIDVVDNPDLALDFSNLESLCKPCHTRETHKKISRSGFEILNLKWK
jgi:5-methylcytosine-specific restriction protein A